MLQGARQAQGGREVLRASQLVDVLEACVAPRKFEILCLASLSHRGAGIQAGMEGLEWLVLGPEGLQ